MIKTVFLQPDLHLGPLHGPPVEMTKAQFSILIGITCGIMDVITSLSIKLEMANEGSIFILL